jgi:hypothetical protein
VISKSPSALIRTRKGFVEVEKIACYDEIGRRELTVEKKDLLTKVLASVGTVLTWIPLLAPILFSTFRFIEGGRLRFDYLMPAELFPVALVGGGLLVWAALRARSRRGMIGWGLGLAVGMLVGGQALAVVTGLASGETEPSGWPMAFVLGSLGLYVLALVVVGVGGVLLVRDLFTQSE